MNLKIVLGALAAGMVAVVGYQLWSDDVVHERVVQSPARVTQAPAAVVPSWPVHAASVAVGDTNRMSNPLQLTHDLRDIYERFRDSKNPRERHIAYRAWSACFPAFLSASGGMAPLTSLPANLPTSDPIATRRADAMRELWGRCKGFSDLSHDKLMAETQRQRDAWMTGRAHSPGDSAAQAHMQGDSKEGLRIARDAIASQDPYAIDSLKDFVIHYWWDLNDTHPEQRVDRPDLRALAFGIAACNMGLECGPASLTAVQQCASTGACSGDAVDRYMQSLPTQSDRDTVLAESRRVERAVRAKDYAGLGLQ